MTKTHNGYNPQAGELPDPRFKPLLIVLPAANRKTIPEYVGWRFKRMLTRSPEETAGVWAPEAVNDYFYEYGLRHLLGYRALNEDQYAALRARILELWEETDPKVCIHPGVKSMMTKTDDGDIEVDLTKNTGPFYCESLLAIEHHFKAKLTPCNGVQRA